MPASTLVLVPPSRTASVVTSAAAESVDVTTLTLEMLVARDISDYSLRRRTPEVPTES